MPVLAASLLLCACSGASNLEDQTERADTAEARADSAEQRVSELEQKIEDIESKVSTLESARSDLESSVSQFDGENWREVVPQVQSAASDVDQAATELRSAID